ncbi:sigma-70 family RNA polymerase sigma factor [Marivirga sp. S37H4]|uniref:Sigma-70 family RNA polymerase sigma factor n=1 Tax=Marivirga aurantiaca TaxID=2802615 RepID=A0A934WYP9_9BACT|nr:sigma-70 family RNA polymerase sigma factor [Marivirga aurantiaca]MBK6265628.1 sigma-70 family RNA polymerase sigma factor [Marivirga aurantiaca]
MNEECRAVFPVYLEFKDEIQRYILKKVKSREVAEDLTSQLALKLHSMCEKLKEVRNLRAWLYRVASNVVIDYFRDEQKKQSQSIVDDLSQDEREEFFYIAVENCVLKLLEQLPDKYKVAVRMSDLEGISQKEIAVKLNISYSAAKMRVQRGRESLKSMFYECCSCITED